ncbi:hypothetical protein GQ43DRAFT_105861 [Delitschia confertaspora ATCC 74209]|uniref:Uncharacterized protein n=1 Tax=Delitschia confertaspora ATCC 74209 TaxID=1513339 RepID=A0A9P4MR86_9PLEO|nr:hypothetical protein GQ43DRAFT_105861 [Delitschia confertaspora ATCC 74209]
MSPLQQAVLVLLGLVASVQGVTCPSCYTQTVAGLKHCPSIPAVSECPEPACVKLETTSIPGPNPACPNTPTVTTYAPCPTMASCRKGCATHTKTITGTSEACGVTWATGVPEYTGSVTWEKPIEETLAPSVTWNKRQSYAGPTGVPVGWEPIDEDPIDEEPVDEDPEDGFPNDEDPGESPIELPIPPKFIPPNSVGIQPPRYTISWGKRQFDYEPTAEPLPVPTDEPTDEPIDDPEEDPTDDFPLPTIAPPPNSVGIQPPKATIIWDKRQDESEPEPTDEPVEDPTDDFPLPTIAPPPNSVGIQPPQATISWDKREAQGNTVGLDFPTGGGYISWDIPTKTKKPHKPKTTSGAGNISWGKRQDGAEPTDDPTDDFPLPTVAPPPDSAGIQPPEASISWDKREAQGNTAGLDFPSGGGFVSWDPPLKTKTRKPHKPKTTITSGAGYISWDKREPQAFTLPPGVTIPNSVSVERPKATIGWAKREPEAEPEAQFALPPGITLPGFGVQPPKATMSWGIKREAEAEAEAEAQGDTIGLDFPSRSDYVSWDVPKSTRTRKPHHPKPTPTPTSGGGYVSWDKREAQENTVGLDFPSGGGYVSWDFPKPHKPTHKPSISWGKREAVAQENTVGLDFPPDNGYVSWDIPKPYKPTHKPFVSWGKREAQENTVGLDFPPDNGYVSWDIPKPHHPKPTQPGYISWNKRNSRLTVAPQPTVAPKPSCTFTKTVTEELHCPMTICPEVLCAFPPTLEIRAEPELVDAKDRKKCPVIVTATKGCPVCGQCPTPTNIKTVTVPAPTTVKTVTTKVTNIPCGPTCCPTKTITQTFTESCASPSCPIAKATACVVPGVVEVDGVIQGVVEKRVVTLVTSVVRTRTVVPLPTLITPSVVPLPTDGISSPIFDPSCPKVTPTSTVIVRTGCPIWTCGWEC